MCFKSIMRTDQLVSKSVSRLRVDVHISFHNTVSLKSRGDRLLLRSVARVTFFSGLCYPPPFIASKVKYVIG